MVKEDFFWAGEVHRSKGFLHVTRGVEGFMSKEVTSVVGKGRMSSGS